MRDFPLPEDWTIERLEHGDYLLIKSSPSRFMATVDFAGRCFRSGLSTTFRPESQGTFAGRSWRERLVAAAVAYLRGLERRAR